MNEISKVLNQNEKILWQGQPQRLPYLAGSFQGMIFGLIWLVVSIPFFMVILRDSGNSNNLPPLILMSLFVLFGAYMTIAPPIYRILVYKHTWYTITDKRAIFQKGLIGRDFDFVDYDKIESATVTVDLLDKIFGKNSGDIVIYANRTVLVQSRSGATVHNKPFVMEHITDPYAIFELFKKTSFDIKSDINFPNVLRPKENRGYQTEYTPDSQNQSDGQTPPQQ